MAATSGSAGAVGTASTVTASGARAQACDPPWRAGVRNGDGDRGEGERRRGRGRSGRRARPRSSRRRRSRLPATSSFPGAPWPNGRSLPAEAGDERGDSDRRERLGAAADVPLDRLNGERHERDQPERGEQRAGRGTRGPLRASPRRGRASRARSRRRASASPSATFPSGRIGAASASARPARGARSVRAPTARANAGAQKAGKKGSIIAPASGGRERGGRGQPSLGERESRVTSTSNSLHDAATVAERAAQLLGERGGRRPLRRVACERVADRADQPLREVGAL